MRNDTDKFRALLNHKESQLLAALRRAQATVADTATPEVQDETDRATGDSQKDAQFDETSREFAELTEVRDAMVRIQNGSFGECEACGRAIEDARLRAIPWARLCIDDARAEEGKVVPPTL